MSIHINKFIRKNILSLEPYSSARSEYTGAEGVFLDANENPFGTLNRYPDPLQVALKTKLSAIKGLPVENIFTGNGSDEAIDLIFRIFCEPGVDKALTFTPTYGMYKVAADINNVEMIELPLTDVFQIDEKAIEPYLSDERIKLMFICSPNNPTGNLIDPKVIENLLQKFNGMVVVDEAYIDFCTQQSFIKWIEKYNNLIVLQTLSKAWALAGVRLGMAFANAELIQVFNKVKAPYNISVLNQQAALKKLGQMNVFKENVSTILSEKTRVIEALKSINNIKKIYPSDANFILVETSDAGRIYNGLLTEHIIIRNRNSVVKNCVRITIGTPQENDLLIQALKNLDNE